MESKSHRRLNNGATQLGLDVSAIRRQFDRANFIVTDANRAALFLSEEFLKSPEAALAITGPAGSGKSHLLHILAHAVGGRVINGEALGPGGTGDHRPVFVDDVHRIEAPLTLLNFVEQSRVKRRKIVLSGAGAPRRWAGGLRDLETRLEAMARASLEEPDEALLKAVIAKRFRERQLRTSEGVAAYAAPRLARTFAAASAFVEAAGAESLATGRPITLALARNVIDNLSEGRSTA